MPRRSTAVLMSDSFPGLAGTPYHENDEARKRQGFLLFGLLRTAAEGGYVAFVPALPGCHTQGETLEETERNVKEAITLYLESLAAHGEPIPEEGRSFQGRVTVPVSVST